MSDIKLTGAAESAMSNLQNTELPPMEEALFQAWAKANQIKKTDLPDDVVDYRGIYKGTGGHILPHGELPRMAKLANDQYKLERVLHERMQDRVKQLTQDKLGELDATAKARDAANQPGAKPTA
jgi:hypothetical protein